MESSQEKIIDIDEHDRSTAERVSSKVDEWELDFRNDTAYFQDETSHYRTGDSWWEGRVELRIYNRLMDPEVRENAQNVLLQAQQILHECMTTEGLVHRPYSQSSPDVGTFSNYETLGHDGEPFCGRIGSILPVATGYSIYGRIDNVQILVRHPHMFAPMVDQMVQTKLTMLRQATEELRSLALKHAGLVTNAETQYRKRIELYSDSHRDRLIALICEQPPTIDLERLLLHWESERQMTVQKWQIEHQAFLLDIEHEYTTKRRDIMQSKLV